MSARLAVATAVALLTSCGSSSPRPSNAARGVLTGVVDSAPTCPVEQAGSPCPPRPVAGAAVVALRGTDARSMARTDAQGRFRLTLAYGTYTIRATNVGGIGSTATKIVTIGPTNAPIELTVDSGIR